MPVVTPTPTAGGLLPKRDSSYTSITTVTGAPTHSKAFEYVLDLSTTLTIQDIQNHYYDISAAYYTPTYKALGDGSLVTSAYANDLTHAFGVLIFLTVLTVIFFRNTIVTADYIRRARVKNKILFYALFGSQVLGPVVLLPILISFFHPSIDCTLVFRLAGITCFISSSILLTGILGAKAYMCLNRSSFVASVLFAVQIPWTVIAALDWSSIETMRLPSGRCIRKSDGLMPIIIVMRCIQALFISCCFFVAVYKSAGSPAMRDKISDVLSMENMDQRVGPSAEADAQESESRSRRGWWDYVPRSDKASQSQEPSRSWSEGLRTFSIELSSTFRRLWSSDPTADDILASRKSSIPGDVPLSQPPRKTQMLGKTQGKSRKHPHDTGFANFHLMPRMVLIREVMRDELCYTTFITVTLVVFTVLAVIGVNMRMALGSWGWLVLNWTIISLLAIHSFGRVVRRHEIEAILHEPWSSDASFKTKRKAIEVLRLARSTGPLAPPTSVPRARRNTSIVSYGSDQGSDHTFDAQMRLFQASKWDDGRPTSQSSNTHLQLPPASPISPTSSHLSIPQHHLGPIPPSLAPSTEDSHPDSPHAVSTLLDHCPQDL